MLRVSVELWAFWECLEVITQLVPAGELKQDDELVSHTGELVHIEAISPLGEIATVYNLRVAEHHTYFVGCKDWNFSIWAHNAYKADAGVQKAFRNYLTEVEKYSGSSISLAQRRRLWKELKAGNVKKLTSAENEIARVDFKSENDLILEWEQKTGKAWPRYRKDHWNDEGNLIVGKGWRYDAHHLLEEHLNGPAEWWNIHPVHRLKHQPGVHRAGGAAQSFEKLI